MPDGAEAPDPADLRAVERLLALYGHLLGYVVRAGDTVHQGQLIGYEGSTGNSTGPHVHFEYRYGGNPTNPLPYLPPNGPNGFNQQFHDIEAEFDAISTVVGSVNTAINSIQKLSLVVSLPVTLTATSASPEFSVEIYDATAADGDVAVKS